MAEDLYKPALRMSLAELEPGFIGKFTTSYSPEQAQMKAEWEALDDITKRGMKDNAARGDGKISWAEIRQAALNTKKAAAEEYDDMRDTTGPDSELA